MTGRLGSRTVRRDDYTDDRVLRGLAKVQTEWLWTCTAFNLDKLVRELGRLRAKVATDVAVAAVN